MSTLDLSSAGGANQPITLAPHNTATLTSAGTYSWIIAQTTGTVTLPAGVSVGDNLLTHAVNGGANTLFVLDTTGFASGFTISGSIPSNISAAFSLELVSSGGGENLVLDYGATPEPGTPLLVLSGVVPLLWNRRRRQRAYG